MATIKYQTARKEYTCQKCGRQIKKGEKYIRFKINRFSKEGIRCVDCKPKKSELTTSEFLSRVYELEEELHSLENITIEEYIDRVRRVINELNELKDETEEKLYNMPEQLQNSDTGSLLEGRIENLDVMIDDLEDALYRLEEALDDIKYMSYMGE